MTLFLEKLKKDIELYSKYAQRNDPLGNLSRLYIEECKDKIERWENEISPVLRKAIENESSEYKGFLVLYIP